MQTATIYTLSDPRKGKDKFYIGQTKIKLSYRVSQHLSASTLSRNNKRTAWIKKLLSLGYKPIVEVLDIVPIEEVSFWEQHYIALFRSWNLDLVNSTTGGEVTILSAEAREKLRQANLGKKHSEETKEKLRQINLGKKQSPETKEKIARAHRGKKKKPHTQEVKDKMSRAKMGTILSQETKDKIGAANKGRTPYIVTATSRTNQALAKAKLTIVQVNEIRRKYATQDINQHELAEQYGTDQPEISRIVNRKVFKYV